MKIKQIILFIWFFLLGSIASAASTQIDFEDSAKIFLDFNQEASSSIENHTRTPELKSLEDLPDEYLHLIHLDNDLRAPSYGRLSNTQPILVTSLFFGIHSGLSPPLS
ncbi:hypothetical protein [Halobacteriovorax sp. CON-3]|uniref:hypothetical protein n=1 Tax=Halobacteriovorax sp. CON-3 TaxID=3157710 RepID=UPI00371304C6